MEKEGARESVQNDTEPETPAVQRLNREEHTEEQPERIDRTTASHRTDAVVTGRSAQRAADESGEPIIAGGGTRLDYDTGPDQQKLAARYGLDFCKRGQATKVRRLESEFGSERVARWAEEGMTVETMAKPRDMQAFRERQEGYPEEVPRDIERRNQASLQRNKDADQDDSPAGDAGAPDEVRRVISKPGTSMDGTVRREMESKMGGDFSDVQLHTGPDAAAAAESINARAFTVGNHVAFNRGEYHPESDTGKELLAHELTHVRQQTDGRVSLFPKADAEHPGAGRHVGDGIHVQPKLEVSSPDDPAEKEAEEVAEEVMQMDDGDAAASEPDSDRAAASAEDTDEERAGRTKRDIGLIRTVPVNRAGGGEVDEETESKVRSAVQGGGKPLPADARASFESKMGADFSDVKVHTGPEANDAAESINAEAYTLGSDIAFSDGSYAPDSQSGKQLLAHELTHVTQQGSSAHPRRQDEVSVYRNQGTTEGDDLDEMGLFNYTDTGYVVVDLQTGSEYPLEQEEHSGMIHIPGATANDDEISGAVTAINRDGFSNVTEIGHLLGKRYAVINPAEQSLHEDPQWSYVDESGERTPVFNVFPGRRKLYVLYLGNDEKITTDSIEALRDHQAYRTNGHLLRRNHAGEETSLYVILNDIWHEVRELNGRYHVALYTGNDVLTDDLSTEELLYSLPGYVEHEDIEGFDEVPEYTLRDEEPEGGREFVEMNREEGGIDVVPQTGDSEEGWVEVIGVDGERETIDIVTAAELREEWLTEIWSLADSIESFRELYTDYRTEYMDDAWMATVAGLSETVGGADFDTGLLNDAINHLSDASNALSTAPMNFQEAQENYTEAKLKYPDIGAEWTEFSHDRAGGAEKVKTALEVTESIAKTVLSTAAKAKFGPKGGIIVDAIYENLGTEAARDWAAEDEEIEWGDQMIGVVIDSVVGIITHVINDNMSDRIKGMLGKPDVDKLPDELGEEFLAEQWGPVKEATAGALTKFIEDSVEGIAEAVGDTFDSLFTDEEVGMTQFFTELWENLLEEFDDIFSLENLLGIVAGKLSELLDKPGWVIEEDMEWGGDVEWGNAEEMTDDGQIIEIISLVEEIVKPFAEQADDLLKG